jgi:hypothetical protein
MLIYFFMGGTVLYIYVCIYITLYGCVWKWCISPQFSGTWWEITGNLHGVPLNFQTNLPEKKNKKTWHGRRLLKGVIVHGHHHINHVTLRHALKQSNADNEEMQPEVAKTWDKITWCLNRISWHVMECQWNINGIISNY